MKQNLLPKLSTIELFDKGGQAVTLEIKLYELEGKYALFMADAHSNPALARSAASLITQLLNRLDLPAASTSFYRHIYLPHQGSVFGNFRLGRQGDTIHHYTFAMMTPNIDDKSVRRMITEGKNIPIPYAKLRNLAAAV